METIFTTPPRTVIARCVFSSIYILATCGNLKTMFRGLVVLLFSLSAIAGPVQSLPALPNGALATSIQLGSTGAIFVAGTLGDATTHDVFVAKLSPDGAQLLYWTVLAGAGNDVPSGLALGPDGSAYVTGGTNSADFPTTPGSLQPARGYTGVGFQGFAAKLDPLGKIAWSTYIGGSASSQGRAIAVDAAGRVYVTGQTFTAGFVATPGSVAGDTTDPSGFILVLDPTGSKALAAIHGFGGNAITLDAQGNIYAAGAFTAPVPTTAGAFQSTASSGYCFTSFLGGTLCQYQHIAKIDPSGTRLLYATYVAGSWGATPAGIALDSDGNLVIAGNTNSPDYPTTPRAYQPHYLFYPAQNSQPHGFIAPVGSGYITKLNPSGTGLTWSTLFSGSTLENPIAGLALDTSGNILIAGLLHSSDVPGVWSNAVAPAVGAAPYSYIARLSADGIHLSPTQILATPVNGNPVGTTPLAVRSDGSAIFAPQLAVVSLSNPPRVASISDVDNTRLVRVAPGQLLTLWGTRLSPADAAQPAGGDFPMSLNGVAVTFNGIAAPILYAAGDQVNLQVPYEIADQTQVTLQATAALGDPPVSESFTLGVVERQPSVLISPENFTRPLFGTAECRGAQFSHCIQPLALNADGTLNSRDNPAPSGSTVTVFVNGAGVTTPAQPTGAIADSQFALTPGVAVPCCFNSSSKVVQMDTIPGSSTTLAQVRIQVSSTSTTALVPLAIEDQPSMILFGVPGTTFVLRDLWVLIWTQPSN